ncbi:MAG: hypothetical protein PHV13_02705 [Candidatus ainarchaeum sp.]|nr:hypothetical protein [Candidatus ainarchaeum sp.]
MAKAKKKPAPKRKAPVRKAKKIPKSRIKKKAPPKVKPAKKAPLRKKPALKKKAPKKIVKAPSAAKTAFPAAPEPRAAPLTLPPIQPVVPSEHEIPPLPKSLGAGPGAVLPALDLLPEWVDRSHLHGVLEEGAVSFAMPKPDSLDFKEGQRLLSKCREANTALPGYFLICAKQADRVAGAIDGYAIGDILIILRSFTSSDEKRDSHMLLHSCALGMAKPSYVACCVERPDFSDAESAGKLIFIGRGLGMSALPFSHPKMLFFMRRVGREYDPLSSGQELAKIAAAMKPLCPEVQAAASEIASKGVVPLVLMPSSPDRMERLRELRDAAIMLDLPAAELDKIFEALKLRYVQSRVDITPPAI